MLATAFSAVDESLVNTYTTSSQMNSAITTTPSGGFAIAWQSSGQDGSGNGIYAQIYDSNGAPSGSEFMVNSYTTGDQVQPDIKALNDGKLAIAWSSNDQDGSNWGVYLAIYQANGNAYNSMTNVIVNEITTDDQSQTIIEVLANDNFVVVYHSSGADSNSYAICAKIYSPTGGIVKNEFVVNSITTNRQMFPKIDSFSDSTFVVTWMDNSSGNYDIRARLFSPDGSPITATEFVVNTYTTGDQLYPAVAVSPDNTFTIVWQSTRQNGPSSIYMQRYTAAAAASGSETQVNTYTANGQVLPAIASVTANSILITWESRLQDGSGLGVFGQRFLANGNKKGTEFQINIDSTGDQNGADVKPYKGIGYIMSWNSNNQDGSANGVYSTIFIDCDVDKVQYGQICLSSCPLSYYAPFFRCITHPLGFDEVQINTYTTGIQAAPAVTTMLNGGYALAWHSFGQDGSSNRIYAQTYAYNGKPISSEFIVNIYTSNAQQQPDIGGLNNGNIAIAWSSNGQDNDSWGVYMAIFTPAGTMVTGPVRVNEITTGDQSQVAMTVLDKGGFVIAYHSSTGDGSGYGIFAKIYSNTGSVVKAEFIVNSVTTGAQTYPTLASFSDSSFVVAWQDNSSGNYDIRARLFLSNGTAVANDFVVNTYTTSDQTFASVASSPDDTFTIGWQSAGQGGFVSGIYFQRYAADGTKSGSETKANTYNLIGQAKVAIASMSASSILITWESTQDGSGRGIYGQRFTAAGARKGSEFQININSVNDQSTPCVTPFQSLGYIVAYSSVGQDFNSVGVFATFFMDCDASKYQLGMSCTSACPTPMYLSTVNYRCQYFYAAFNDVQVNTYYLNNQMNPMLTTTQDGGYAIVWQSRAQDGSDNGIYAQTYNYESYKVSSEIQVNSYTTSDQQKPDIGSLRNGNVVMVWQSNSGSDSSDWGVYMAIFTMNGTTVMATTQVNDYTSQDQSQPSIAVLTSGNFVICWHSNGQDSSEYAIMCKIYTQDGSVVQSEITANSITNNNQQYPAVASLTDGTFVVIWQDNSTGNFDIRARIFSATGTASAAEFVVNSYTSGNQTMPFVTGVTDGTYIVTWQGTGSGCTACVYFQRFSGTSASYSGDQQANTFSSNAQYAPSVAALSSNTFLVTWDSTSQDGSGKGVYGQRYLINGQKKGSEFLINVYTSGDQSTSCSKPFQNLGYLVTWTSANQDGNNLGIFYTFMMDCDASKYQFGLSCVSSCPAGYYQTSVNYRCQDCSIGCTSCTGASSCSACGIGYYLSNSACSTCDSTCYACSNTGSTSCTACTGNRYLLNSACVTSCGNGYYADPASQTCKTCDGSCATCSGGYTYNCLTCRSGKYMQNSACVTTCSAGYYPDSGTMTCKACSSSCGSCSTSASTCTSCPSGTYLYNSACRSTCPSAYYADAASSTCKACSSSCTACTTSASTCTSCSANNYLYNSACSTTCPSGYYPDTSTQTCKACSSSCGSCSTSASTCTSCPSGSSTYLYNNACGLTCPTAYYADSASLTCEACSSSCATCTTSASTCTSCNSNTYLHNNACGSTCPSSYYADSTSLSCKACSSSCATCSGSASSCTSCPSGSNTYLYNNACRSTCPTAYYADSASLICKACSSSCATCSGSASSCSSCPSGSSTYLYNNACGSTCPTAYYADTASLTCKACSSSCATCTTSASNCASCNTNTYLYNNACGSTCPSGYYADSASLTCKACDSTCTTCTTSATTCTSCTGTRYLLSSSCVTSCGTGNYADSSSQTCKTCSSTCSTCASSATSCTSCSGSTYLYNSACGTTCPTGYYADSASNTCKTCDSSCPTCATSSTSCTSCAGSRYLYNSACDTSCPTGYYADSASNTCKSCDSSCAGCSEAATTCTSCPSTATLSGSICVGACTSGNYLDNTAQACKPCNPNCATCSTSATTCTSCTGSTYLLNSACVTNCGTGYYPDSSLNTCKTCDSSCTTCASSATSCTSCTGSKYLLNSACVTNCGTGNYADSSSNTCNTCHNSCATCSGSATNCLTCSRSNYLQSSSCVTTCATGSFAQSSDHTCAVCDSSCATCSGSATSCTSCSTGKFVSGPSCASCDSSCAACSGSATSCTACASNQMLSGSSCTTCDSSCATCSGSTTTCTSCSGSTYLKNSSCVTNCGSGYTADSNSRQCISTSSNNGGGTGDNTGGADGNSGNPNQTVAAGNSDPQKLPIIIASAIVGSISVVSLAYMTKAYFAAKRRRVSPVQEANKYAKAVKAPPKLSKSRAPEANELNSPDSARTSPMTPDNFSQNRQNAYVNRIRALRAQKNLNSNL